MSRHLLLLLSFAWLSGSMWEGFCHTLNLCLDFHKIIAIFVAQGILEAPHVEKATRQELEESGFLIVKTSQQELPECRAYAEQYIRWLTFLPSRGEALIQRAAFYIGAKCFLQVECLVITKEWISLVSEILNTILTATWCSEKQSSIYVFWLFYIKRRIHPMKSCTHKKVQAWNIWTRKSVQFSEWQ